MKKVKKVGFLLCKNIVDSSNTAHQELCDADGHVKTEQNQCPLIAVSDTCLCPYAMMVKLVNTLPTGTAMRYSW